MIEAALARAASESAPRFEAARIEALLRPCDSSRLPGVAAGIALDGEVVYRKAFGLASMELPLALSPSTRMRLASVSKHFTALGYLLLCEDQRCTLDDSLATLLPALEWVPRDVTARQLLSHTGGLRDVFDLSWHFNGLAPRVSSAQLLASYAGIDDRNGSPGHGWCYSNGGYLIMSAVIERLSGKSLEHFLRTRIFEPAGMYDTQLRRVDSDFVERSATLHAPCADGSFDKSSFGTAMAGEGGVVSTVDDMLRWSLQMANPVVGSAQTWRALGTPCVLPNGVSTGYGLGLALGRYRGLEMLSHSGDVMGGSAHWLTLPSAGLSIVVLTNRGDVWASLLAEQLLDACFPSLPEASLPLARMPVTGCFRSASTGRVVELFRSDDRQFASVEGRDVPCEADPGGGLRPAGPWRELLKCRLISTGAPSELISLRLEELGYVDELMPVSAADPQRSRSIEGRYESTALDVRARISATRGETHLQFTGPFGSSPYQLEPLGDNLWRARSLESPFLGGVLTIAADASRFHFSTLRTRALTFNRHE